MWIRIPLKSEATRVISTKNQTDNPRITVDVLITQEPKGCLQNLHISTSNFNKLGGANWQRGKCPNESVRGGELSQKHTTITCRGCLRAIAWGTVRGKYPYPHAGLQVSTSLYF